MNRKGTQEKFPRRAYHHQLPKVDKQDVETRRHLSRLSNLAATYSEFFAFHKTWNRLWD